MRYRPEGLVQDPDAEDGPPGPREDAATAAPARFGLRAWLRWVWRQLTSMRVALLLLLLLAVVAIPGSFIPQRDQAPEGVAQYYADYPDLAPIMDRFSLFDVYASPWFAAVYLLLFISLVGCIVPRAVDHARALRTPPPKAPRRFTRFDNHAAFVSPLGAPQAADAVTGALRGYRIRREEAEGVTTLSAEKGYLREAGNITFHLALVGLLLSVLYGSLVHYRGQVIVVEGDTFANSRLAYDSFDSGVWYADGDLDPFRMTLEEFTAEFTDAGRAVDFQADVTVTEDGESRAEVIRLNAPLRVGGAAVSLQGNGYAPQVTVRDGNGELAFSGAVPFVPEDDIGYTSRGVIKVPDTTTDYQVGLNGWFLPTGVVDGDQAFSLSPDPENPMLVLDVWYGDLGLDLGVPQNVYELDTTAMTQVTEEVEGGQEPVRVIVTLGETVDLPEGLGSITFEAVPRFAGFDLRYDPTLGWVLAFALLALAGLCASLFLPRRRVFARIGTDGQGRTVVTAAALARNDDPGLGRELERVLAPVRPAPEQAVEQVQEHQDDGGAPARKDV
ncbi:cytochrome c biogenesis protein ResB [Serinibacter salmoneus]|uniref:Cytochrome c biogenesis protein n=1 Tax=Serinibacter salmoneus TaxID=556530 RepID=A0A2A9D2G7_9MICO|nr:cytochrome c biogenesis protein ResB [Serinibacter salmoneus]PFG20571.1 cytochrome c biogenesis protein [Serinibacter salmoneus]